MLFGQRRLALVLSRLLAPLGVEIASQRRDIEALSAKVATMSTALDNLKAAVAAQTSVDQSAVTLIQGLAGQLKAVSTDADVQALADEINAAATPLASALAANTPAAATGAGTAGATGGAGPTGDAATGTAAAASTT